MDHWFHSLRDAVALHWYMRPTTKISLRAFYSSIDNNIFIYVNISWIKELYGNALDSIEEFAYLYDIIIRLQILNSIQDGNEIYTLPNKAR